MHTYTVRGVVKEVTSYLGFLACEVNTSIGLKWKEVGFEKPSSGTEIKDELLAEALQKQVEFKKEEWENFQVTNLSSNSYIKAGECYFKPVDVLPTKQQQSKLHLRMNWKNRLYKLAADGLLKYVKKARYDTIQAEARQKQDEEAAAERARDQEAARSEREEEEAMVRAREEEEARRKEEADQKAAEQVRQDADQKAVGQARQKQEEEAAAERAREEEEAARRVWEEEAARRNGEEEEARIRAREEEEARQKEEADQKASEKAAGKLLLPL